MTEEIWKQNFFFDPILKSQITEKVERIVARYPVILTLETTWSERSRDPEIYWPS